MSAPPITPVALQPIEHRQPALPRAATRPPAPAPRTGTIWPRPARRYPAARSRRASRSCRGTGLRAVEICAPASAAGARAWRQRRRDRQQRPGPVGAPPPRSTRSSQASVAGGDGGEVGRHDQRGHQPARRQRRDQQPDQREQAELRDRRGSPRTPCRSAPAPPWRRPGRRPADAPQGGRRRLAPLAMADQQHRGSPRVMPSIVMPKPNATPCTNPNTAWTDQRRHPDAQHHRDRDRGDHQRRAEPPPEQPQPDQQRGEDRQPLDIRPHRRRPRRCRAPPVPLSSSRADPRPARPRERVRDGAPWRVPAPPRSIPPAASRARISARAPSAGEPRHPVLGPHAALPGPAPCAGARNRRRRVGQPELHHQRRGRGVQPVEHTLEIAAQRRPAKACGVTAGESR